VLQWIVSFSLPVNLCLQRLHYAGHCRRRLETRGLTAARNFNLLARAD
jgi:hypothetical protein